MSKFRDLEDLLSGEDKLVIDKNIANMLGVCASVVYGRIAYWCNVNKKYHKDRLKIGIDHNRHGKFWMFLSVRKMSEDISIYSERTIKLKCKRHFRKSKVFGHILWRL